MEIKEIFAIVGIFLVVFSYIPYIRHMLSGRTKPHVFSYFLWSLVTFIVFSLQLSAGGGLGAWITFTLGVIILVVFGLSFRYGTTDITRTDKVLLVLALFAIPVWLIADQPVISVVLLASIDLIAFYPTVRKSWYAPWSETLSLYLFATLRHMLAIIPLAEINVITAFYPATWMVACALFSAMLILRRKQTSATTLNFLQP